MSLFDKLNNGETKLKSLKYGHDREGGGSSNQPYIKTPLDAKLPSSLDFLSNDFILRGGPVGAPLAAATDVARLSKYFTDLKSPSGLLFIAKQNLLSRLAARTETSGKFINEGVYTPLSTLSQTAVGFTGIHLNKQGLNPIPGSVGSLRNYEDVVKANNRSSVNDFPSSFTTQLPNPNYIPFNQSAFESQLQASELGPGGIGDIVGSSASTLAPQFIDELQLKPASFKNRLLNIWYNKLQTKNQNSDVITYSGGPGSILGIGKTHIRFADQRTGVNNNELKNSGFFTTTENGYFDYSVFSRTAARPLYYQISGIFNGKGLSSLYSYIVFDNGNELYPDNKFNNTDDKDSITKFNNSVYLNEDGNPADGFIPSFNVNPDKLKTGLLSREYQGELKNVILPLGASNLFNDVQPSGSSTLDRPILSDYTPDATLSYPEAIDPNSSTHFKSYDDEKSLNLTYSQEILNLIKPEDLYRSKKNVTDFRDLIRQGLLQSKDTELKDLGKLTISNAPNYTKYNIENRVKLGNPGKSTGKNLTSYTKGSDGNGYASIDSYDKINYKELYSSETITQDVLIDLVNFRIAAIDNDDPTNKVYMHFRAFLGSITDNYNATWNPQKYVGRGENLYTYDGFDRKISLSFTVAAQSKAELMPMYRKLNYLASQLAPDYSKTGYMRGPLVTLTIGGYIYEQPGFITGLSFDMSEDTSWEIGIGDDGELIKMTSYNDSKVVPQLAHVIKVNGFSFTPIHQFAPRKADWRHQDATPFIMNEVIKPAPAPIPPPQPNPSPVPPPLPPVQTSETIRIISDTTTSQAAGINQKNEAITRSLVNKGVIPKQKEITDPFEAANITKDDFRKKNDLIFALGSNRRVGP
jgi:hypothetical protein